MPAPSSGPSPAGSGAASSPPSPASPRARRLGRPERLYFQTQDGTCNEESLVEFVRDLRPHFRGEQRHWLEVRRLPAYAPELNPVEGLWPNLKSQELANRCETHAQMVTIAARQGANRVRSQRSLLLGLYRHTGLQL